MTNSGAVSSTTAERPWVPCSAAAGEAERSPPSVLASDHPSRSPDSKPSAQSASWLVIAIAEGPGPAAKGEPGIGASAPSEPTAQAEMLAPPLLAA